MAAINFFDTTYRIESARDDTEFGLLDPGNNLPAVICDSNQGQAVVYNSKKHLLDFVAIDHNIVILKPDGNLESTCDAMLFDKKEFLVFVELKDVASGWVTEAVGQLENTIRLFKENHYYEDFKRRYAYAANRQHPTFHYSLKEEMQRFKNDTDFHLRISNAIKISY